MIERRIVCAANRNCEGEIVLGVRHFDDFMHKAIEDASFQYSSNLYEYESEKIQWVRSKQGFIDNHNNFLTREEAWLVAEKANQIINRVGGDMSKDGVGKLFSENLY